MLLLSMPPAGVESVALRLQNVYGPGQSLSNPYTGILSIFSTQFLNDEGVRVFEDGQESRDFVFIEDVVDAFATACTASLQNPTLVVDIGSGRATTVSEVADRLRQHLGREAESVTVTGEFRVGDIRHASADLARARDELGWEPSTDLEDGLARLLDWVQSGVLPESGGLARALDEMERLGLLGQASTGKDATP